MEFSASRISALSLCVMTVSLCVGASALSCQRRAIEGLDSIEQVAWPPPPDPPRIRYVKSIRVPSDLGIRRNWFVRVVSRLAHGRVPHEMVRPFAVAAGPEGTIAVADPDAHGVHVFDAVHGRYRRLTFAEGKPLVSPIGIAFDGAGRICVSDSFRRAVFRFDPAGRWIDTLADSTKLLRPTGLAFDRAHDRLLVVDTLGHRVVALDADGRQVLESGRRGSGDGEFNYPVAVAVDATGSIYVNDSMNFRVQVLDGNGRFVRGFGSAGTGPGDLDKPKGIAVDGEGHVYLVDALHDAVQVFDSRGGLLTVLGGTGIGPGQFWLPAGIHVTADDDIFVADSANRRVQVLRYLGESPEPRAGT